MLDKVITYSFYLLFFLTPLFWTSKNYELFEYNKMILVYGFTVIIVGAWLLKIINLPAGRQVVNRTPLDIPLLLFLLANILSTIFSIDVHTSLWGYYSRSNGGLLSLTSYLLLYWAYCSNMDFGKVLTTLKFGLASGFLISLYAILEHFGVSPSCIILRGQFNADCWIQDVQARVFATLGQPNWLAAYLGMLIFPAIYFLLTATTKRQRVTYYLLLVTFYLAFTFTYSRGPTLGLIGGVAVFILMLSLRHPERSEGSSELGRSLVSLGMTKMGGILATFLIINILFGSALTSFRLVSKFAAPARPAIALPSAPSSGTQLENGGTESGQIRFIVWKGALDIFKHYPILGSGIETFAYSYYQSRPVEHNLTSEWDSLYNKAHNEYLNYLATTGIIGLGSYSIIIITFIIFILRNLGSKNSLLLISLFAAYISYLIYNFFLFSVVIIAVFFYLFPALVFVITDSTKPIVNFQLSIVNFIYHRPLYTKVAFSIVITSTLYLLFSIFQLWYADTVFNQGEKATDAGNVGKAYSFLTDAVELNKNEPLYRSELAYSAAAASAALKESDATLSAQLRDQAVLDMGRVLHMSPNNISFLRTAIRTFFELAVWDKKYVDLTLQTVNKAIKLAPTDPKLYYNKALILEVQGKKDEEVAVLNQTLKLKPNYQEALDQLKQATESATTPK